MPDRIALRNQPPPNPPPLSPLALVSAEASSADDDGGGGGGGGGVGEESAAAVDASALRSMTSVTVSVKFARSRTTASPTREAAADAFAKNPPKRSFMVISSSTLLFVRVVASAAA